MVRSQLDLFDNYGAYISEEYGSKSYLDYDKLKKIIHRNDNKDITPGYDTVGEFDDCFLTAFEREIAKIEEFFNAKLSEINEEFSYIKSDINNFSEENKAPSAIKAEEFKIKRDLSQLYGSVKKLDQFRLLNNVLCIKILKKFDKVNKGKQSPIYVKYHDKIALMEFGSGSRLVTIQQTIVHVYANFFCHGNLEEAHGKLELEKEHQNHQHGLYVAFKMGALFTLLVWYLNSTLMSSDATVDFFLIDDPGIFLYAAVGSIIVYRWFWGLCIYLWDIVHIDFTSLLNLDCKKHIPHAYNIFDSSATITILYLWNLLIYTALRHTVSLGETPYIPVYLMPLSLTFGAMVGLLLSLPGKQSNGLYSWRVLYNIFTSPIYPADVREIIAADVLVSFSRQIANVVYGICYLTSGTVFQANDSEADLSESFAVCTTESVTAVVIAAMSVTYFIRLVQCLRKWYEVLHCCPVSPPPQADSKGDVPVDPSMQFDTSVVEDSLGEVEAVPLGDNEDVYNPMNETPSASPSTLSPKSVLESDESSKPDEVQVVEGGMNGTSSFKIGIRKRIYRPRTFKFIQVINRKHRFKSSIAAFIHKYFVWPHAYNVLKYSLSLIVVIFGKFPPVSVDSPNYQAWLIFYITLCAVTTIYQTYWDFVMDWGFFNPHSKKHKFLRASLMYDNPKIGVWYYYFVLILNPILRSMWTLSFTPWGSQAFFAVFEVLRRCIWLTLRLDYLHVQSLDKRRILLH